jgi:hypothetical protein
MKEKVSTQMLYVMVDSSGSMSDVDLRKITMYLKNSTQEDLG